VEFIGSLGKASGYLLDISVRFLAALWLTETPIQWVPGDLFLGVKRPRSEADHSLP